MKRAIPTMAWASALVLITSFATAALADKPTAPIDQEQHNGAHQGEEAHSTPPGVDLNGPADTTVTGRQARLANLQGRWNARVRAADSLGDMATSEGVFQNSVTGDFLEQRMTSATRGRAVRGHVMTGYDPATRQYWSSWTDDNGNEMVVTENTGRSHGAGTLIGPDGRPMPLRTEIRSPDPGTEVVTLFGRMNGREITVMEITYTRS